MKRLLVLGLVLGLSGCGGGIDADQSRSLAIAEMESQLSTELEQQGLDHSQAVCLHGEPKVFVCNTYYPLEKQNGQWVAALATYRVAVREAPVDGYADWTAKTRDQTDGPRVVRGSGSGRLLM